MRILHISDTHSRHRFLNDLPAADLIVHSGDLSWSGKPDEVLDFIEWFKGLEYRYKIFIAGNHDYCLDGKNPKRILRFLPDNCFYLYQSGITIEGLKFWGIPYFISDELKGNFRQSAEKIPKGIDILITHRPAFGILDTSQDMTYGCADLLKAVLKIAPRYHLFGHIHDACGMKKINATTFINASILDETCQPANDPFVFEI